LAQQFVTWLVCQFCGRVAAKDDAPFWLNEPHKDSRDYNVVRCPQHWSEWALRNTRKGRTNEMRERMAEALAQPAPVMPPHLEPFPTQEREMRHGQQAPTAQT
jgi:hypothetical protein